MAIAYTASANINSSAPQEIEVDGANNRVYIIETTGPSFRIHNLTTGAAINTFFLGIAAPRSLVVAGASAIIANSTNGSIEVCDIASGTLATFSGGSVLSAVRRPQRGAYNPTTGNVIFCPSGSRTLSKFNVTTSTATNSTSVAAQVNQVFYCIIYIGNNRFLIGSDRGRLYEIDDSFNITRTLILPPYLDGTVQAVTGAGTNAAIIGLAKENNLLYVLLGNGWTILLDYSTNTVIKIACPGPLDTTSDTHTVSNVYNGTVLYSRGTAQSSSGAFNHVDEVDITMSPFTIRDILYSGNTAAFNTQARIDTSSGKFAIVQGTSTPSLVVGTLTSRLSSSIEISSPGNVDVDLTLLHDMTSSVNVIMDTRTTSPATFRIPVTGSTIQIMKAGDGADAQWAVSRY